MDKRKLDISNYEEWFIDYLDGTLDEAQVAALDAFLIAHPELSEELEGMETITLESSDQSYPDHSGLLIPSENELAIMSAVEEGDHVYLDARPEYKTLADDLKQCRLEVDESIIFSNKETLKKKGGVLIPLWIQRTAIAAALTGLVLSTFFIGEEENYMPRQTSSIDLQVDPTEILSVDENDILAFALEYGLTLQEESEKSTPSDTPRYKSIPAPFVQIAQDIPLEDVEDDIEVDPAVTEEEFITQDVQEEIEDSVEQISMEDSQTAKGLMADANEPAVNVNSGTTEYTSALDLLKRATAGSDLLALNDAKPDAAYVQTSLKVGGFELSVKRKRRRR